MEDGKIASLRLSLVRIGIESCLTFATIAQTKYELGKNHDAERFLADGEKEYLSLLRLIAGTRTSPLEALTELKSEMVVVRGRLNEVKQLSHIYS